MPSRTRLFVLFASTPLILLIVVGGFLSRALAGQGSYQHLKVFQEVVALIVNSYVEEVDTDKVMRGAMLGLADGLDADSAYLSPALVKTVGEPLDGAGVGLELTRQYYLRVIASLEGSPAHRAGLRTGDYIRMIGSRPTRDVSVFEGMRLLRGPKGTSVELTVIRGNAADPHVITLVREPLPEPAVTGRIARPGVGLIRITGFVDDTAKALAARAAALRKSGATHLVIDLRATATGAPRLGVEPARLFVGSGTVAMRGRRGAPKEPIAAGEGDGSLTLPVTLLVDNGTTAAAEVFAAALAGAKRAELVGERTLGRVAEQELVPLPDGSGLWLSTRWFLTPDGAVLHEKGLTPDVAVEGPDVEFGAVEPATDPILDKALERIATTLSKAAA